MCFETGKGAGWIADSSCLPGACCVAMKRARWIAGASSLLRCVFCGEKRSTLQGRAGALGATWPWGSSAYAPGGAGAPTGQAPALVGAPAPPVRDRAPSPPPAGAAWHCGGCARAGHMTDANRRWHSHPRDDALTGTARCARGQGAARSGSTCAALRPDSGGPNGPALWPARVWQMDTKASIRPTRSLTPPRWGQHSLEFLSGHGQGRWGTVWQAVVWVRRSVRHGHAFSWLSYMSSYKTSSPIPLRETTDGQATSLPASCSPTD